MSQPIQGQVQIHHSKVILEINFEVVKPYTNRSKVKLLKWLNENGLPAPNTNPDVKILGLTIVPYNP